MSATIVDEYLETPMEADDAFPCKGCGEILEEGKAFELDAAGDRCAVSGRDLIALDRHALSHIIVNYLAAFFLCHVPGNRWHLDCFRCTTCGSLLDSDANLLLLGDGSLICNNCTYSCSACGNKIEDLAILTGDQAFCSTCFRCRNCKRKIENLRYARTSQGIFCMDCYETLMARRRKKSKAAAAAKAREKEQPPMVPEKSLPALPPGAIPNNAFSNDRVDPDGPTELSPRPRTGHRHNESSARTADASKDGLGLPSTTYRRNRNSTITSNNGDGGDGFLISVALDTSGSPNGTQKSASDSAGEAGKKKDKDHMNVPRPTMSDKRVDSHSSATHIAFLGAAAAAASRQPTDHEASQAKSSSRSTSKSESGQTKSSPSTDEGKLQDAPKKRRPTESRSDSSQSIPQQQEGTPNRTGTSTPRKDSTSQSEPRKAMDNTPGSRASYDSKAQDDGEAPTAKFGPRSDSVKSIPRKEVPSASTRSVNGSPSASQGKSEDATTSTPRQSPPSRSGATEKNLTDTYMQPRAAPLPPSSQAQTPPREAASASKSSHASPSSPKLPRWSSGADFTMEEDMARILGADEGASSILRRVSNAVRHGRTSSVESSQNPPASRGTHTRSISETTRGAISPRWPKTQDDANGQGQEGGSPASLSPPDNAAVLKQQLRSSEQRVAELERQFGAEKDLLNLNQKLIEKRKTVSVLDTQTEIMIRQLEVLAGYVERAKETQTPIDPRELEESAIKEFVQKLEQVKQTFTEEIERLHEERDQLVEEKSQAVADRDRALMEFEQLSSKNAQLADMNNDLTHQIQERFKSQISSDGKSNGLGIYGQHKGASSINLDSASVTTGTTLIADEDPTIVEHGPTVVHVRKGQVKKFNWKKGSKTMAQNITKGVGRAVVAFQNDRERMQQQGLAGDGIGLPYNMTVAQGDSSNIATPNPQPGKQHQQQPFGFFGKKNNINTNAKTGLVAPANIVVAQAAPEPPSTLFGSELADRCEFEHRQIPSVVTRCIEEVELRGMDQEGIYRKTGGNSQINMIKEGFDKSENYDISDPDLDITAVTSVLKQYFRKLPNPLLTFDVYEKVLESNAVTDEAERCSFLHKVFTSMPPAHRDCLEFLMFHLHRVAIREPENLMSPKNLAVVFAPTIMRDLSIEREMTDMHAKNIAVQFVIENTHKIFEDE
ncbi:rho gtpase activator rga [Trichoderma arundinaceum]|uniref:Rho gtpase activator rga n=1 Tax=Trichoderma arundinaceum TaxID=490622 RepID=A0A395N829_TRIAR|nr:rho gtpase activator rga [Trichoderma arundinaceum]